MHNSRSGWSWALHPRCFVPARTWRVHWVVVVVAFFQVSCVSSCRSRDTKPREAFDQGCYCHLKKLHVLCAMVCWYAGMFVLWSKRCKAIKIIKICLSQGPASNCEEQNPEIVSNTLRYFQLTGCATCLIANDCISGEQPRSHMSNKVLKTPCMHTSRRRFQLFLAKLGLFLLFHNQPTAVTAFFQTIVLQDFQQTWPQTIVLRFSEFQQRLIFDSSGWMMWIREMNCTGQLQYLNLEKCFH